jgi:putative membrane protein
MSIILNVLLLSVAIFVVANLLPSVHVKNYGTAIIVAVVYSFVSFIAGWFLALITFPLIVITFGLFKYVINAFLLWVTDQLVDGFELRGIGATLIAAFLITIVDSLLRWILY